MGNNLLLMDKFNKNYKVMGNVKKTSLLTGTLIAGSLMCSGDITAANTLTFDYLGTGAELRTHLLSDNTVNILLTATDGLKSIEGSCGKKKADKKAETKTADMKCGEGKCGEGKCGDKKAKTEAKSKDMKCGEGKCGEKKAERKASKKASKKSESKTTDMKCGEGKCGGK